MSKANKNVEIIVFQKNLSAFRKIAGWTVEELATRIDVTKQTISNLELEKTNMTMVQYIALRSVFEMHIEEENDETLAKVMDALLNHLEGLTEEEAEIVVEKFKTPVTVIASSAYEGGVKGDDLKKISDDLLKGAGYVGAAAAVAAIGAAGVVGAIPGMVLGGAAPWLAKLIKK